MKLQHHWSRRLISLLAMLLACATLFTSCAPAVNSIVETSKPSDTTSTTTTSNDDHHHHDETTEHVHSWSEWVTVKEPTCTSEGEQTKSCPCGEFAVQILDAIEHDYISVLMPSTCTEQGYTTHTCNSCGDSYVDSYVDAKGHSYGNWETVTPATCEVNGLQKRSCSCGAFETEAIPATGHTYASVVTPPTCIDRGYTTYTCACGSTYVDNYVDAKGHDYGDWYTSEPSSCTATGVERRDCKNCTNYETKNSPVLEHTYTTKVTEPTCTAQGYTTYTCSCGHIYVDNYVNAKGHSYGDWQIVTPATCEEKGLKKRTCSCNAFETEDIPAKGHDYASVITPPTCTEQGYTTYTCACGKTYVDDYVKATGHDYKSVVTPPTCTEQGYTTYTCACGHTYVDNYVNAKGHNYSNITTDNQGTTTYTCDCGYSYKVNCEHKLSAWSTVNEATCTIDGLERRDCDKCNYYETKSIKATGHDHKAVVTPPTCTEQGYTTHTCHCGDTYVDTYVKANGHNYGDWYTYAPSSCTATGVERRDCKNCSHYETNSTSATGHTYTSKVTEPTCTEQGYTTHTCHCGDTYTDTYVDATGHSYREWTEINAPSCTEMGEEKRTCSCGAFETKKTNAKGHDYKSVVTPSTCTEQGYTTHTCHCGSTYVDSYASANGHSFSSWAIVNSPTCTEIGLERRDCEICEYFTTQIIDATGHDHISTVTPPTCMAQGYTTHCCHCGDTYVDTYVSIIDHIDNGRGICSMCGDECEHTHSYTVKNVTDDCLATAATCTQPAQYYYSCTCDAIGTETFEYGETIYHHFLYVETPPTCTSQGSVRYICKCGRILNYGWDIPALPHSYGEWETITEATCTTDGLKKHVCACGHSETETIPATGHDLISQVSPKTCTTDGYSYNKCSNCDFENMTVLSATGHKVTEYVSYTEPTCVLGGSYSGYCDVCDELIEETLTAKGHTASELIFNNDYCGENKLGHIICTVCDTTIAEFGHSYKETIIKATCTENGKKVYACEYCSSKYEETIRSGGHLAGEWIVITPAGCTTDGTQGRYCTTCNELVETSSISAIGHNYSSAISSDGITYTCGNCNDSYFVKTTEYITITFLCGGEKICNDMQIVKGDTAVLPALSRENYDFLGWYLDEGLTNLCLETYVFAEDTTLYGTWAENSIVTESSTNNLISDAPLDFTFTITANVDLTNENLANYVFVTDTGEKFAQIYISAKSDDVYTIAGTNYQPGMTYQVLLRDGIYFTDVARKSPRI